MKNHMKSILIYNISHKTLIGSRPLQIRFDKIDAIVTIYDGTRYLTLFGTKKWQYLRQNSMSYKSNKQYHIYFLPLFCENKS